MSNAGTIDHPTWAEAFATAHRDGELQVNTDDQWVDWDDMFPGDTPQWDDWYNDRDRLRIKPKRPS